MSDNTTSPKPAADHDASPDAVWAAIATERRRLADELSGLTTEQWNTQSQCDAWTVRDVAAHLVTPFQMSTPKFVFTLIKNRTNFDRTMIDLTAGTANRYRTEELIELLRSVTRRTAGPLQVVVRRFPLARSSCTAKTSGTHSTWLIPSRRRSCP